MHILIIPSWYKTPRKPVKGTFFEEQARMLQKLGHTVGILFPNHELRFMAISRLGKESTPDDFVDNEIPTYYSFSQSIIPGVDVPTSIDIQMCGKKGFKKYEAYEKKYGRPDIIHAHSTLWGGVVAEYISRKKKIPYFLTKHFTGWILSGKRKEKQAYRNIIKKIISNSEKTFVVSSFYKNELLSTYSLDENKMEVIHNIVNPMFFLDRKPIEVFSPFKLAVVAYLVERKNHKTLFDAMEILNKEGLRIHLSLIGDGRYMGELQKYLKEKDLESQVEFHGLLGREAVAEVIRSHHAVVSASTYETFGVNLIEGLAAGRPVISLDSGGPQDIVRPQDGVLFKENSPKAFAEAIRKVHANYQDYDQSEISEQCKARFSEAAISQKIIKHYENSLKQ